MHRRHLKPLRVAVALSILAGLMAVFTDFRGLVPARLAHWLTAVQFTSALLALGTGVAALVIFAGIIGVTLAFGRVYCSTVCPLGLLQDAVARIAAWLRPRRRLLAFRPGSIWIRYGGLAAVIATIAGGAGAIAYSHADPYSNFGRISSGLFRPLLVAVNNALVDPAQALGLHWFYRVVPPWPGAAVLGPALFVLVLVTGLAVWRERIYCNTLCPLGTVLGLLARGAAFRLTTSRAACTRCAECLRGCKAQCIDLRTGTIDASRCVACFNCIAACPENGIGYRFAWTRSRRGSDAPAADPQRRALLVGGAAALFAPATMFGAVAAAAAPANRSSPVTPPGSGGADRFLEKCIACQLCVTACPTAVLQPALSEYGFLGFMKPRLDFQRAFCNFDCRRCGEVCPTGAISLLALADKQVTRIGRAQLDLEKCIVKTKGTDCAACSEHCPTKAVDTIPYGANLRLPQVADDLCIGCGACEYACPAQPKKAIVVAGQRQHERATRRIEEKAKDPRKQGDFPF